jgi:hypothetical protein
MARDLPNNMSMVKGVLRNKLRERPFDFFVALVLFFIGFAVIVDDSWPEKGVNNSLIQLIVLVISIYLMAAAVIIMMSLSCNRRSKPILSLMGEMYGWMMISFASIAILLTYLGSIVADGPSSWWGFAIMMLLWLGMLFSSSVRFIDLFQVYGSLKR